MDVLCAGILVADIFSQPLDSLPQAGELIQTDRFLLTTGGCAANVAAALRRLGHSSGVLGKVGRDPFGDLIVAELEQQRIDTSGVRRSDELHTSETFILNVRGEDRRYLHYFGANADFSLADIDRTLLDQALVLYIGGFLAMPSFSGVDVIQLFREAKQRSLITVLDVVIAANAGFGRDEIRAALAHTDYFLPNEDEARWITGADDVSAQIAALAKIGPSCTTIVTRGARGAILAHGAELIEVDGYGLDAVDASGAGDAFAAGFVCGLLRKWPLRDTLQFANAVGASCTRAVGCTAGVFTYNEAISFVREHHRPPGAD